MGRTRGGLPEPGVQERPPQGPVSCAKGGCHTVTQGRNIQAEKQQLTRRPGVFVTQGHVPTREAE